MVTSPWAQKPIRTIKKNGSAAGKYKRAYVHVLQRTTEVKKDTKQLAVNATTDHNNKN